MSLYEKIVVPKKLHPTIFWILFGVIIFSIQEFLLQLTGENIFLVARAWLILGGICGLPIAAIDTERAFHRLLQNLDQVISFPTDDYNDWLNRRKLDFLALSTKQGRLYVFAVYLIVISFFSFILGWPYEKEVSNLILAIFSTLSIIVAAHGSYLIISLVKLLSRISNYPVKTPFYLVKHPELMKLSRFYNRTTLITLLFYFWIVLLFWLSPYGMSLPVIIFLGVLGFYPSAILLWSFFKIHSIMQIAKQEHVLLINTEVQLCIKEIQNGATKENTEKLSYLLNAQKIVEDEKEWPFNLESIMTLFVTVIVPITNIFITV